VTTARLEAFSDGVFAIAITLLVLEIKVPDVPTLDALGDLWSSYLAYAVSFLLIGLVWANHHTMFDHIGRSDRALLFFNTLLLADVAFIPFATAVMARTLRISQHEELGAALYGATIAVGGLPFNLVWWWARRQDLLDGSITRRRATILARRFWLGPVLYGLGALLALLSPWAAIVLYALLIVFYWIEPLAVMRSAAPRPTP
jgi:uncharacterized membrane protein